MKQSNYLLVDVETGGFDHKVNPVCEICMQVVDDEGIHLDTYTSRIKVYNNLVLNEEAVKKNGLSVEILERTGKPWVTVVNECEAFMNKYVPDDKNKLIFVAHNVGFDLGFVNDMFRRADKQFMKYIKTYTDTMALAKMFGNTDYFNLESVCKAFGVKVENAHSAKGDVDAMRKAFCIMLSKMRNNENKVDFKFGF